MSAAWKESISLEETNKIRISLGLKPIAAEPDSAATDPDALAEKNYALKLQRQQEEAASLALKAKIDKIRNGRERNKRLTGVGLGAEDAEAAAVKAEEGVSDNKAWIKQQKKRAKELALKREKEQAEADLRDQEGLKEYTEKDLQGIKVSHEADDFEEGEEVVLTLKDSRILDEEDDELHNLNIAENSATADALALKKKGKQAGQYTGYDDEEFAEGGTDAKASVLKKYDEEIEGKQESGFRLGGTVPVAAKGKGKGRQKSEDKEEKERVVLSMDYTKTFTTDYFVEGEVGFKKPKMKKKKRATKVNTAQSDDESTPVAAVVPSTVERINLDEANLVDDDDLQASLARSRREAAKKRLLEMKERKKNGMDVEVKAEVEEDDGDDVIIMDDTSEFVRNISLIQARPPPVVKAEIVEPPPVFDGAVSMIPYIKKEEGEEDDVPMTELATNGGWGPPREDGEESDSGDMETNSADVYGGDDLPNAGTDDIKPQLDIEDGAFETTGSTETLVSRGMASTLNLLRHQGLLETRTPEQIAADLARKTREAWIWSQRRRDDEREEERRRAKEAGGSKDQGQREYENRMRDAAEARQAVEAFGNYEPVVDIKYHDEFGRDQTPKEAWKQLSHNFHGKGSGNMKTEKRLKKIAEEKKRLSMASGDTPLSSASAFAARAEKTGSAIMVLSVGNKGSAPMAEATLTKTTKKAPSASTIAKGKGKASGESSVFGDIPMRSLPLPAATPYPSASAAWAEKRAGFAPIGQTSAANGYEGTNGVGLGVGGGMGKVQIPTSIKRKAAGAPAGESESKK